MPTTPADVSGMLKKAIRSDNPVLCFEHRWLYWQEGLVPDKFDAEDYDAPKKISSGSDITLVGTSWMNVEILQAMEFLEKFHGVKCSHFDLRSTNCMENLSSIIKSINETRYCLIADNDWLSGGISAELSTRLYGACYSSLRAPIARVGFESMPCPTARHMENHFYPNSLDIIRCCEKLLKLPKAPIEIEKLYSHENRFKGPF